jgi:[acyl-carrier-protein] S-malonyltransferase
LYGHVSIHAGPKEKLDSTAVSQPAIYVASLAALEKLKQESPDVVAACNVAAGLSLGEYTALAFADALSFEDGLKLVRQPLLHVLRLNTKIDTITGLSALLAGDESHKIADLCLPPPQTCSPVACRFERSWGVAQGCVDPVREAWFR